MDQDIALLVDRWRDGELDAAERAALANRLRQDPEYAQRFHAELRFQGCVAGLLKQDGDALWRHVDDALTIGATTTVADRVLERVEREHPRTRRWWPWAAAAASVLVALGGLMAGLAWLRTPIGVTIAVLDDRANMQARQEVPAGSRVSCGNDQRAQMDFSDGSKVEVGSGGTVQLTNLDKRGAHLELEDGPLSAHIAKQKAKAHFVVRTDDAVLTVLGTRFTAIRLPWGTRVAVTEGRVLTRRALDNTEIEVPAGMWVEVDHRRQSPIILRPLQPPLPAGATAREPEADSIVVGGRYAQVNRGHFPSHILTSPAAPSDEQRQYYLRFDLRGVARPVARAELGLHLNQIKMPGMELVVETVQAPWGEYTINWAGRPAAGPVVGMWHPGPDDAPIDLTAAVNAAGDTLSLRIRAADGTPAPAVVGFFTRESQPHQRPRLVLIPSGAAPQP